MAEKIVFACVHNAGRSQMAAAFFNRLADPHNAFAVSAGTEPAEKVHPEVVEVMREAGIDLSNATPQRLSADVARNARWLITMGCGDACPFVPGARIDDWAIEDPRGKPRDRVRQIRDEIERRVRDLVAGLGARRTGT